MMARILRVYPNVGIIQGQVDTRRTQDDMSYSGRIQYEEARQYYWHVEGVLVKYFTYKIRSGKQEQPIMVVIWTESEM